MKKIVGIATMKGREQSLVDTIESLLPQVDYIYVYSNDYAPKEEQFDFSIKGKVMFTWDDKFEKDLGDIGKFEKYNNNKDSYFFSCDDDLVYPNDYCDIMISFYNYHSPDIGQMPIISCHGRKFINPITDYYKNGIKYHCLHKIDYSVWVDCGGTGCMMIAGQLKFKIEDFKTKNMADIWIALFAKAQNIPIACLAHESNWIKHTTKIDESKTIYSQSVNNCEEQTKLINTVQW